MRFTFFAPLLLMTVISCDISDNDAEPSNSFLKIYDNNTFNADFTPIDVQQTAEGGYIVLGASILDNSVFAGAYTMIVDENGDFVSEENFGDQFLTPSNELVKVDDRFYFLAMTEPGWNSFLITLNSDGSTGETIPLQTYYPLAVTASGNEIIYSSYDSVIRGMEINKFNLNNGELSAIERQRFSIGEGDNSDIERLIIESFTTRDRQFPFFVGKTTTGMYYYNGFYDFTLSLVFTDFNGGDPDGLLQGTRETAGLGSAVSLGGEQFAISTFEDGENFIIPSASIPMIPPTPNTPAESTLDLNILGNPFPELIKNAPVRLKMLDIDGRSVLLYGSTTKSGQILLLAYSPETQELLGTRYLGFSNPYALASFNVTEDNGLIVLASTSVAGRFERFALFKLSAGELAELTN